jgi:hypothetical protein
VEGKKDLISKRGCALSFGVGCTVYSFSRNISHGPIGGLGPGAETRRTEELVLCAKPLLCAVTGKPAPINGICKVRRSVLALSDRPAFIQYSTYAQYLSAI